MASVRARSSRFDGARVDGVAETEKAASCKRSAAAALPERVDALVPAIESQIEVTTVL